MQASSHVAHVATTFCGINIFNIEDELDLDNLSAEGHTTPYINQPIDWWKAHGLTYIPEMHGPIVVDEWVGVTLEQCAGEEEDDSGVYSEWTFNDVKELVRARFERATASVIDYDDIGWATVISTMPDIFGTYWHNHDETDDDDSDD